MIIDNNINAYFINVNENASAFNIFNEINIIQFEIENAILHEIIFIEREMLKTNTIHHSSRKWWIVYFNRENNYGFFLIVKRFDKVSISAITLFVIKFVISSIVILFVFEFVIIVIIIIIIIVIIISFIVIIIKVVIEIVLTTFIKELIAFRFDIIMLFAINAIFD